MRKNVLKERLSKKNLSSSLFCAMIVARLRLDYILRLMSIGI